jgi:hypothetical protein
VKTLQLIFIFTIIFFEQSYSFAQIHGYVLSSESNEKLEGVTIQNLSTMNISFSNNYGYFSIIGKRNDTLKFSYIGYEELNFLSDSINIKKPIEIELKRAKNTLESVIVKAKVDELYTSKSMGKVHLTAKSIKEIPMLLGEKDPIKALQFLPGIQEISEGSSSISVRGGEVDQNLLLLDEATVYNANHLFGFFSTFNADPIKEMNAYKGAFPAQYGGRLSSIIDVKMREGNNKKFAVEGGIGLISSRVMIEGPIKKNSSSFLISGRRTYADVLILPFQSERSKTSYHFGDLNSKVNFKLNAKNDIYFSAYTGKDIFYEKNKIPRRESFLLNNTSLEWGNITVSSRWNKIYSQKLFQNLSLIYTKYQMKYLENTTQDYLNPPRIEDFEMHSGIEDYSLKFDFDYYPYSDLSIKWGGILTQHQFSPRKLKYSTSENEPPFENNSTEVRNLEGAGYINFIGKHHKFFYETGLRLSYYQTPSQVSPEPRILVGYSMSPKQTLSFSYSKMNQYLHLISNTGNGLPTDVWIPSNRNLNKSSADILSLSLNIKPNDTYSLVFETYYKWIFGNTAYKSGVSFLGIGQGKPDTPFQWENSLTQGRAWNYGYEVGLQKSKGKLTGFAGYTLAWSISKFADINNGEPFYNRQDRRNILEMSLLYRMNKRLSLSSNVIFASGNALPLPNGVFFKEDRYNNYLEAYGGINSFRAENYHRVDLGLLLKSKKGNASWEFGVYNAYNRKNPYSYEISDKIDNNSRQQNVKIKRQWLLPVLPSITYNFKF